MIDSPPIASLADSIVLGSVTDMTVLVIKQNENDREPTRRCVEQLRKQAAFPGRSGPGFSFVRPSVDGAAETR